MASKEYLFRAAKAHHPSFEASTSIKDLVNDKKIGQNSVDYWIDTLNAAGVPCGRVQDMDTLFRDPQLLSQDMVLTVDHTGHGPIRMTGFPVKMSETPCELRLPAPELGADTETVLRELGYGAEKIAALRDNGVT